MDPEALTIYRVARDGVSRYRFLRPEQVQELIAQGWIVRKVRITK